MAARSSWTGIILLVQGNVALGDAAFDSNNKVVLQM
jgi:hypothetical protein